MGVAASAGGTTTVSTTGSINANVDDSAQPPEPARASSQRTGLRFIEHHQPGLDQLGESQVHDLLIGGKAGAAMNLGGHLRLGGVAVAQGA